MSKKIIILLISSLLGAYFILALTGNLEDKSDKPNLKVWYLPFETPQIIINLLEKNYNLVLDPINPEIFIRGIYGAEEDYKFSRILRIAQTQEAMKSQYKKVDLFLGFDLFEHSKHFRYPFYYDLPFADKIALEYSREDDFGRCPAQKKYFACFLMSNNASGANSLNGKPWDGVADRIALFHKLLEYKFIASGGNAFNNIGYTVPKSETMEWLKQCKFVIAYENQRVEGYITEKLFQAYYAGAIPIYNGHPSVLNDVNKEAFIYSGDFNNTQALIDHIKFLDNDDEAYCKMWNEKIINKREKTQAFVQAALEKKILTLLSRKLNEPPLLSLAP